MKIRFMGTLDELQAILPALYNLRGKPGVQYVEISQPYPNRKPSEFWRLYVEVQATASRVEVFEFAPANSAPCPTCAVADGGNVPAINSRFCPDCGRRTDGRLLL